jgi:[acyl-carrier-protein] S-malonyltransferase
MGWDLCTEFPRANEILEAASELCGFPLKQYCLRGPEEMLTRTDVLQPALTAINLACIELLREHGQTPDAVAGHSLGELAALYAADVLTLSDTLRLATARGRLMHRASQERPGGMIAVKNVSDTTIAEIVQLAGRAYAISIANFNAPGETVLSGETAGIECAIRLITESGGRAIPLRVSGGWHSPLMQAIVPEFAAVVDGTQFATPTVPIYVNVTARPETHPAKLQELLVRQVTSPVRWREIVELLAGHGIRTWLEVGPGKVLRGLLRRILPKTEYVAHGIDKPRSVRQLAPEAERVTP